MKTYDIFKNYIWLVKTIYKAGYITLEDINDKWIETDMSGGVPLSRSTFNRYRTSIEDIFGLNVDCLIKGGYKYYISNAEVLRKNSIQNWMIDTLSISSILDESMSIQNRIIIEKIPSAKDFLCNIIEAMKTNQDILISYKKFNCDYSYTFSVSPYCLKCFHQRWYMLGFSGVGSPAVYALDRIENAELTDRKFELPSDFDAEGYFSECYGVIVGDATKAERIVLRVSKGLREYYRTLPIHHSQTEITTEDNYSDFEYYLRPTIDFRQEILSHGSSIKVMYPKSLRQIIIQEIKLALDIYS